MHLPNDPKLSASSVPGLPARLEQTRTFKFRLYPSHVQIAALELHLAEACRLYNAAVQERRDAWRLRRVRVSYYDQGRQLKDIRAAGDLGIVNFDCARDVLRRVQRAFDGFFRRVKAGQKPGYPRFRSVRRYDSLTWEVRHGAYLRERHLSLHGIGDVRVKFHRPVTGEPRQVIVHREAGRWFAHVTCACQAEPLPVRESSVGIDVGLHSFAVLSDATVIDNPRHARAAERRFRRAQRRVARRRRGSNGRRRAIALLQRSHVRLRNQRADFHHKVSRRVVADYGRIAVEDLNIRGLARTRMAKSVLDAGWRSFLDKLAYKAASAGRDYAEVDARGTSQACLCGAAAPKALNIRRHRCSACGLSAPRDLVSAMLIERLGRSRWARTVPSEERLPMKPETESSRGRRDELSLTSAEGAGQ